MLKFFKYEFKGDGSAMINGDAISACQLKDDISFGETALGNHDCCSTARGLTQHLQEDFQLQKETLVNVPSAAQMRSVFMATKGPLVLYCNIIRTDRSHSPYHAFVIFKTSAGKSILIQSSIKDDYTPGFSLQAYLDAVLAKKAHIFEGEEVGEIFDSLGNFSLHLENGHKDLARKELDKILRIPANKVYVNLNHSCVFMARIYSH